MMNAINFIEINKVKNSPTIVFLHEGLGCIKSWKNYPEKLCKSVGLNGIVYDRPGYGQSKGDLSNRTNDYLIEAAHDLDVFLKPLKLEHIILYGHSDGGSIALAYAAIYPEKVICLITEAAHVLNEDITVSGIKKAVLAYENGKLDGLIKWHGYEYRNVFDAWSKTWLKPDFDLKNLKALLPKIVVDQLIIQGSGDQYGTLKQVNSIVEHTKGNTEIFIPDCGHSPYLETPDDVLLKASNFIKLQIDAST